jgi:hypothetical protein
MIIPLRGAGTPSSLLVNLNVSVTAVLAPSRLGRNEGPIVAAVLACASVGTAAHANADAAAVRAAALRPARDASLKVGFTVRVVVCPDGRQCFGQGILALLMTFEPSWKLNSEATGQPPCGQLFGVIRPFT